MTITQRADEFLANWDREWERAKRAHVEETELERRIRAGTERRTDWIVKKLEGRAA